jgi:rod shape determining protein RodA
MYQRDRLNSELSFFQKIKEIDYTLLICIILLSIISLLVMYSTDGGEVLYHTKSHFSKLVVFFPLMILIAFLNIRHWHTFGYIYFIS